MRSVSPSIASDPSEPTICREVKRSELIQLKAKQYELVWPENAAQSKLEWPMKGWKAS